jgi:hypothetical protein
MYIITPKLAGASFLRVILPNCNPEAIKARPYPRIQKSFHAQEKA